MRNRGRHVGKKNVIVILVSECWKFLGRTKVTKKGTLKKEKVVFTKNKKEKEKVALWRVLNFDGLG